MSRFAELVKEFERFVEEISPMTKYLLTCATIPIVPKNECEGFLYEDGDWNTGRNFHGKNECSYCCDHFDSHKNGTVRFYDLKEEIGAFTNFWVCNLNVMGVFFNTTEHMFQFMKFLLCGYEEVALSILRCSTAREVFNLAQRNRGLNLRKWHTNFKSFNLPLKNIVMFFCCFKKFESDDYLQEMLIKTGNSELIEDSPVDAYWGRGEKWDGQNWLGRILMVVRKILYQGN